MKGLHLQPLFFKGKGSEKTVSRKLLLVFLPLFLGIVVGCGTKWDEPDVNRTHAVGSERDTYMSRSVWFPATYVVDEKGKPTYDPDLETLFQKANDWIEDNEERISSLSVDIVNATVLRYTDDTGSQLSIPSGILIVYTLK